MPHRSRSPITVVGIGADGWTGVPQRLRDLVEGADVLLGGPRHLALVPETAGLVRAPWPSPLREGLPALLERYDGQRIVALASGDPLVSGIGTTLIDLLGPERVHIEPAVSSVSLAAARMRWPAESFEVISLVGRDPSGLLRALAPGHRLVVLSSDAGTAETVAALLTDAGYGRSRITVLGDLGADDETCHVASAATWVGSPPDLNILAIELNGSGYGARAGGLPDEAFEHDGQLTKRDLRASALARLAPQPGQLLWDVGAGAGSVGIEWLRSQPTTRAIAVEADPERVARITRNARALGVPGLEVVTGHAPEALKALPDPHAIFVGGGATVEWLLQTCLGKLRPGGRLVVHGVTVETEGLLAAQYAHHGGELTRIHTETAAPIGSFTGWTPARAVTQWAYTKEKP
ncbi:Precorrin-6Y C(5,15)-methyltransferase [metagenome]|uniref:Precorrin-6Y C(5,15)-methyltransferase n=1 Tax=metagenome TaxID=256318 RepID=A0A2P2C4Q3_9ZZZZ